MGGITGGMERGRWQWRHHSGPAHPTPPCPPAPPAMLDPGWPFWTGAICLVYIYKVWLSVTWACPLTASSAHQYGPTWARLGQAGPASPASRPVNQGEVDPATGGGSVCTTHIGHCHRLQVMAGPDKLPINLRELVAVKRCGRQLGGGGPSDAWGPQSPLTLTLLLIKWGGLAAACLRGHKVALQEAESH